MSVPTALIEVSPNRRRSRAERRLHLASPEPVPPTTLMFDGIEAVEIVAPDRYCAMLLLGYATPLFAAEIVSGPGWVVRFQSPPTGGDWVTELLALVERWLTSAPIPCAKIRRGGRSYLIRGPLDAA